MFTTVFFVEILVFQSFFGGNIGTGAGAGGFYLTNLDFPQIAGGPISLPCWRSRSVREIALMISPQKGCFIGVFLGGKK